jgi:hypothetical protein
MITETEQLEQALATACTEVGVAEHEVRAAHSLLAPLRDKGPIPHIHYLHSLRVGLTARAIGHTTHQDERALLLAGVLHDIGKAQVPVAILGKVNEWSRADQRIIQRHVMDGYRLLRGRFDFSAEIMLWHHRFQANGYPKVLPAPLHKYSHSTKAQIVEYGRLLALADVYDALHRPNNKFETGAPLTGLEIREKMLAFNPDRIPLVEMLYDTGVFATN